MPTPSFEEFDKGEPAHPSFEEFLKQSAPPTPPPGIAASAWEGMKAGILPELGRFAERKALGMSAEKAPEDKRTLGQKAKETGRAIVGALKDRPAATAAYLAGNLLVDAPVYAGLNMIPGVGEAADAAWLAKVARALAPAAKGGAAAGAQSAAQQLGEKGGVSGKELATEVAAGAALPAAGSILKAPINMMAKAQFPRSAQRAETLDRAKALGIDPLPEEASGTTGGKAGALVASALTPQGRKIAEAKRVENSKKMNSIINEQAGITSDIADPEMIQRNLKGTQATYANKVAPERIRADDQLRTDLRDLERQASRLDINDKNFVAKLEFLATPPPGSRAYIPGDQYIRMRTMLRDSRTSAMSRGDMYAANFYRDTQRVMDDAFDRSLKAQGKTAELDSIKDLRGKLTANYDLVDLVQKGGVHDGHYDAKKLFGLLNADPNSKVSTKLWQDKTPMERVASIADELDMEHPFGDPTSAGHSVWPTKAWMAHYLATLSPPAAAATMAGVAGHYGGVPGAAAALGTALAYPYIWRNAPKLAGINATPLAAPVGGAVEAYRESQQ